MTDTASAIQDFEDLRAEAGGALLATLSADGAPSASYAPVVWLRCSCFVFLSELASHTANLRANPTTSLLILQPESRAANAFARQRISLQGEAAVVGREQPLFDEVLAEFHRRFGSVMSIIEPLPDFHLFRIGLTSGQFVRGFGQAYQLAGDNLDELHHINPA